MIEPRLLQVFVVLAETQSVSKAAETLGVSQPALSASLRKLRTALDDPLFVRSGRSLAMTDRGRALAEKAQTVLEQLDALTEREPAFDPKTDPLVLKIAASDFTLGSILPTIVAELTAAAPRTRLEFRPLELNALEQTLASGALDLAVLPTALVPENLKVRRLFEERFVCLLRRDHPAASKPLTKPALAELRHIRVAPAMTRSGSPVDAAFQAAKLRRDIALTVPNYQLVPPLIAQSDLVSFFPFRWAETLDKRFVTRKSPIHLKPTQLSLVWHPARQLAPPHAWARQFLAQAAKIADTRQRTLTSR